MKERTIPFSPPDIGTEEIREVCAALQSGWITTGPRTKEFETLLAKYCGVSHVACLNSATAAEELNLRMLGVGPGDEVLLPAYTYTATAAAAIHVGATVKLIDSQPGHWEMDYEQMEEAITERTKAVIPVDIGGVLCDYEAVFEAAEGKRSCFHPANDIQEAIGRPAVVADCAHSLGASFRGKRAGAIADFSSFSFHAVKNLTTAEGGAACTRDIPGIDGDQLYQQYQLMSLHGQSKDALAKSRMGAWEYDIIAPWYKCNMTDVAAAIGIRQLKRYPDMIRRRGEVIKRYDEVCDRLGLLHLNHHDGQSKSSGHLYMARIPWADHKMRGVIIGEMAARGISCNVHYIPLPMMTAYKNLGFDIREYPNAYRYFEQEITLPLHTRLTDEDVEYVVWNLEDAVKKTMKHR